MRVKLAILLLVTLCGCGSDGDGTPPTLSTPPPPVELPLNGAYDLIVTPAEECGLPQAPYTLPVIVTTFATGDGNELRATLPGGGDDLTLDMLYPFPGRLEGALSTRALEPVPAGGWLFLRNNGWGVVSLSPDGRAEVVDGVMAGAVDFSPDDITVLTCSSTGHRWALVAL